MTKKKKYRWFIQPLDSHTNQVLAAEITEENLRRDVVCGDHKKRNLWQCEYPMVNYLMKSRSALKIRFRVFVQAGEGVVREWNLTRRRKKEQRRKVRKTKRSL